MSLSETLKQLLDQYPHTEVEEELMKLIKQQRDSSASSDSSSRMPLQHVQQNSPTMKSNRAKCALCKDVVESLHADDFQRCHCGEIAVAGGPHGVKGAKSDLNNIIDLSEGAEF